MLKLSMIMNNAMKNEQVNTYLSFGSAGRIQKYADRTRVVSAQVQLIVTSQSTSDYRFRRVYP